MIGKLVCKNFKALADVTIELSRLTVLIGPNAAGKSSVLEALNALGKLMDLEVDETTANARLKDWAAELRRTRTKGVPDALTIEVRYLSGEMVALELPAADKYTIKNGRGSVEVPRPDVFDFLRAMQEAQPFSTTLLRLEARALEEPSLSEDELPALESNGLGLASVLAHLARTEPDRFQVVQDDVRKVLLRTGRFKIPRLKETRAEVEPITIDGQVVHRSVMRARVFDQLEVEVGPAGFLTADLLSEGTLRTIGLVTAIHALHARSAPILLLDDVDAGLHPRAQAELIRLLRALLEANPNLQIVCTTHSPYLLDAFEESEVRVISADANGHAHCRSLAEHPDWPRWKGMMKLGEFWSSVGDDWVMGG